MGFVNCAPAFTAPTAVASVLEEISLNAVDNKKNTPARKVAYTGILAACSIMALFLATVLPTNRIFFYGLSSLFVSIVVLEFGTGVGVTFYTATSLLALMLIPNKIKLIPYFFILGHYGIWKVFIDKHPSFILKTLLKLLILNLGTIVTYHIVSGLFINIILPFDIKLIFLGLQILFLIYDYAFNVFISFYLERIRKN